MASWLSRIMNWSIMRYTHLKHPTNSLPAGSSMASSSSPCWTTKNRLTFIIADKMGGYSSGPLQPPPAIVLDA
jgi:hypothetical protein